ncbi:MULTISPECIES: ABC transporter permease [unclassified Micromonospora]|uniref:ABC transporter permease n=1 Tax=unclassified Micromonospora TaxID=2617518 RepID=UPI003624D5C4
MLTYLVKRLLALLPTALVPVVMVFVIIRLAPGDPAAQILGDQATPEQVAALRHQLGLDAALLAQFGAFLRKLVTLDLGDSLFLHEPVRDLIPGYAAVTLEIGLLSLALSTVGGMAIGMVAAFRRGRPDGRIASAVGIIGISIPQFWFGLLLVVVFAVQVRAFPVSGYRTWSEGVGPHLQAIFLPALTLALAQLGIVSRMVSSSIVDVLHEPFVTTARSLGVRPARIRTAHVMRVVSVEILTIMGLLLATVLSGSVVVENIFGIPGMGRLLFDAVGRRDYDVIQGVVLFVGIFIIVVNLAVDVLYAVVDPRVRYGKAADR